MLTPDVNDDVAVPPIESIGAEGLAPLPPLYTKLLPPFKTATVDDLPANDTNPPPL